tara:strand:+ start:2049 stop:2846 length:798 start_codon:yes stop_codon:yes gene_type:complete
MIKNISIIGAGNLTKAILSGINRQKNFYTINLIDINKNKRSLQKKYDINFSSTFTSNISKSDLIFLIVKPGEYRSVLKKINKFLSNRSILISFMAGISHDQIKENIDSNTPIVRCMTNLTIANFDSYIFYYSKTLDAKTTKSLNNFFSKFSKLSKCRSEDEIDKITALYGSGPAYYIFFNKIVRDSFIQMGYSIKDSKKFTCDLLEGTTKLIEGSNNLDKIINSIASKGGTTEAALREFKKSKIQQSLTKAIFKAYKKSKNILRK